MKTTTFILISLLTIFMGCDTVEKLTQFNMNYDESVVIPSNTVIDLPFQISTPEVETNSESKFAINNTRKDMIEKIILIKMSLTLTSPDGEDFSFLESINIYIHAEGLDEVKIAWKDEISSNTEDVLDLETTGTDIQEYIKKDKFSLRIHTTTDEVLTNDHHIDVKSTYFVDAKILGL